MQLSLSFANLRAAWRPLRWLLVLVAVTSLAHAHIGSPDTFLQAAIGPYNVLIAAHPPAVTPGALELDLRFNPDDHLTSATAALDDAPPAPLQLVLDGTGAISLWDATPATHVLHITVQGSRGPGVYTVTLPAQPNVAATSSTVNHLHSVLLVLSLMLLSSAVVLAARRPRRRGYALLLVSAGLIMALPLMHRAHPVTVLTADLTPSGHLDLTLTNPSESFREIVPDHGKLLHLFLVREPNKDVFLHLHPVQISSGHFDAALPAMPSGTYTLFADFYLQSAAGVHGETTTLRLALPQQSRSTSTDPDDSTAVLPPLTQTLSSRPTNGSGETPVFGAVTDPSGTAAPHIFHLRDGYSLQLAVPPRLIPLRANLLRVTLLDPTGAPPPDMALYLGMTAHAIVLRSDDQVFAHIHPGGTLPMLMPIAAMPGMNMPPPSNVATIPYGFPTPGRYRFFVQMRHGHIIETAAFDLDVQPN